MGRFEHKAFNRSNKESKTHFSTPSYLPPRQKSAAYYGTVAIKREHAKSRSFKDQKKGEPEKNVN
jgi:hypothetical protein